MQVGVIGAGYVGLVTAAGLSALGHKVVVGEIDPTKVEALEAGEISSARYESFMKLARESAFHEMSFLEKRKKDRAFGKMIKTVMKHKKNKR